MHEIWKVLNEAQAEGRVSELDLVTVSAALHFVDEEAGANFAMNYGAKTLNNLYRILSGGER